MIHFISDLMLCAEVLELLKLLLRYNIIPLGCFKSIFFSTDSVACLSEYVTGDKIHWCGGNFGIAFAVLVHGQKIGSSQHSRKKYFFKIPKKVSL